MQEGKPFPDFTASDQDGNRVRLRDFHGRPLVFFFYPRAGTSGCTIEVQEFRDAYPQFQQLGVAVLGASPDTPRAQKRFHEKEACPFPLLADETRQLVQQYGLLKEKNMYGRKVMGVARTTFLIGADGTLVKTMNRVKPEGHAEEVLRELKTW